MALQNSIDNLNKQKQDMEQSLNEIADGAEELGSPKINRANLKSEYATQMTNTFLGNIMTPNQIASGLLNKIVNQKLAPMNSIKKWKISKIYDYFYTGEMETGSSIVRNANGVANATVSDLATPNATGQTVADIAIGQNLVTPNMYEVYFSGVKNSSGSYGFTFNQTVPMEVLKLAFISPANFNKTIEQWHGELDQTSDLFKLTKFINYMFKVAPPKNVINYTVTVPTGEDWTNATKFQVALKEFFYTVDLASSQFTNKFNIGATLNTSVTPNTYDFSALKATPYANMSFSDDSEIEARPGVLDIKECLFFVPLRTLNKIKRGILDIKFNNQYWKFEDVEIPAENVIPTYQSAEVNALPKTQGAPIPTNAKMVTVDLVPANQIWCIGKDAYEIMHMWDRLLSNDWANPMITTLRRQFSPIYAFIPWGQGFIFQSDALALETA